MRRSNLGSTKNRASRTPKGARAAKSSRVGKICRNVLVESLDSNGRGIARSDGKIVFIEGALPGESVDFEIIRDQAKFTEARSIHIEQASSDRVVAACDHFDECGGCRLQHLSHSAQVDAGERALLATLKRIGHIEPEQLLAPLTANEWNYRRRARLAVGRDMDSVFAGFMPRSGDAPFRLQECPVLGVSLADSIDEIQQLARLLPGKARGAELELVEAANGRWALAKLQSMPSEEIQQELAEFQQRFHWNIWIAVKGNEAQAIDPESCLPNYQLPEFGLTLEFEPNEFVQGNELVNQQLVGKALELLDIKPSERVFDLFCGIGNFSLPLAASGAQVIGVEAVAKQLERAEANACLNGLKSSTEWQAADLFSRPQRLFQKLKQADAWLLDPPRDGAKAVVEALNSKIAPSRIVYVSCNPATLARDAAILVEKGYEYSSLAYADMFPHTGHIESISLFKQR